MIISYDVRMSIDPLLEIFRQYLSMCEGGWSVSLVIYTTIPPTNRFKDYISSKNYCYAIKASYRVRFKIADSNIHYRLSLQHRKTVAAELNKYDLFIYHEDDVIITHANVIAYIEETKNLYTLNHSSLNNNMIGFQRYFIEKQPSQITEGYLTRWRERYQEFPDYHRICHHGVVYMDCNKNTHQAMWILTRAQIEILQNKCSFLDQTLEDEQGDSFLVREYMSSFSIFRNNFGFENNSCGLKKMIPLSTINRFVVHHYYKGLIQPDGKSIQEYFVGFNADQIESPACDVTANSG